MPDLVSEYTDCHAMFQLEKISGLFACETEQAWENLLFSIAEDYGFQYTLYRVLCHQKALFESSFLKSNYPAQWRAQYQELQFHLIDPIVSHCRSSRLPIIWKRETFADQKQRDFYEQACSYGFESGICYPVHGSQGEFGMLSFFGSARQSQDEPFCREKLASLSLIRDYVFESSIKFFRHGASSTINVKLTARELECLKLMMDGKSSWDMSAILHCSEATINFHASNLRKKFNVRTRQQVIVQAIKEGIVRPA